MLKKILFAYPPSGIINREDRCQVPTKDVVIAPPLPPSDLLYMAASARAAGAECRIKDYTLDGLCLGDLERDISEFNPDYLVLSVTTPTLARDMRSCAAAKRIKPDITVIAKGAHFLKLDIKTLEDYPELDIAMRGEAEGVIAALLSGLPLAEVKGISWRGSGGITRNPDAGFEDNLDSLPYPARDLIDNTRYVRPDNGRPQAVIRVARGCPYNCFFCLATPVSGARVRKRSPQNIIGEIKECQERYGINDFLFWSDTFNTDRAWAAALCEAIIASGLKFSWATNSRADNVDLAAAKLMRRAGCALVSVGIESGSPEILEKIGKKVSVAQMREAFKVFRAAGLKTFAYYVIGMPWDTKETVRATIDLALELDSDFANFFVATPFPGTRFYDYAVDTGLLRGYEQALFDDAYYIPPIAGHHLSRPEITELHKEAVRRFFLRPGYILKSALNLRSWAELVNYSRAALNIIRKSGRVSK